MIECLGALRDVRTPLIVDEATGGLAQAARASGAGPVTWLRHAVAAAQVQPVAWPPAGSFDAALIRQPKSKEALDLALHAAASRLPTAAPVLVFGANAEGIRSVARLMGEVADDVATLATGHHARVIMGRRRDRIDGLREELADWRRVGPVEIGGRQRAWVSYPGTFAKGGLDDGTRFLLQHLPDLPRQARVLDFAAGTGVIAAAIAASTPNARLAMIDADSLAIEAARENVPDARAVVGLDLAAAGAGPYDLIVSNPPIHDGIVESRAVLNRLIAAAPRQLRTGGRLLLVVQRRVAVMPALMAAFGNANMLADNGRFTVAMATCARDDREI